jgi:hypothetical protein
MWRGVVLGSSLPSRPRGILQSRCAWHSCCGRSRARNVAQQKLCHVSDSRVGDGQDVLIGPMRMRRGCALAAPTPCRPILPNPAALAVVGRLRPLPLLRPAESALLASPHARPRREPGPAHGRSQPRLPRRDRSQGGRLAAAMGGAGVLRGAPGPAPTAKAVPRPHPPALRGARPCCGPSGGGGARLGVRSALRPRSPRRTLRCRPPSYAPPPATPAARPARPARLHRAAGPRAACGVQRAACGVRRTGRAARAACGVWRAGGGGRAGRAASGVGCAGRAGRGA